MKTHHSVYQPPLPSRATRKVLHRSKASGPGAMVARLKAHTRPVTVDYESGLEGRTAHLLAARRDIFDLRSQPPFVEYIDDAGRNRKHVFDFLATLDSGLRIAVAVKPWQRVIQRRFDEELKLVAEAMPARFAERVLLVTDRHINKTAARNATLFNLFWLHPDDEADARVLSVAKMMGETFRLGDLMEKSNLGSRAFTAVVRGIYRGPFSADLTLPLSYTSILSAKETV
tara:strand:- start:76 stop:762 length:687 start_codon:yes stop_codon:yes gene_type:complete